jgi:PPOX class probable FMN-dependent enzyme
MQRIDDIAELEALYDRPSRLALLKVVTALTPGYRRWIAASRFCILSTVGPEGTDATPRGDDGPVVRIVDDETLWLPDWRGNNRLDALRNIVEDGRVSLMFMIPGNSSVIRVNGTAVLTADKAVTESFEKDGKHPSTVVVIRVGEVYFQCAKALIRSGLWDGVAPADVPSAGDLLKERDGSFDAEDYDKGYEAYAAPRMW